MEKVANLESVYSVIYVSTQKLGFLFVKNSKKVVLSAPWCDFVWPKVQTLSSLATQVDLYSYFRQVNFCMTLDRILNHS